jgi:hypothetical protein
VVVGTRIGGCLRIGTRPCTRSRRPGEKQRYSS